jgi:hypothetical protein
MDKTRFLDLAPAYYALGVLLVLNDERKGTYPQISGGMVSVRENSFSGKSVHYHLRHKNLFEKAAQWLEGEGILQVRTDPFGPTIYLLKVDGDKAITFFAERKISPFEGWLENGRDRQWLTEALEKISDYYQELGITSLDFEKGSGADRLPEHDEWAPIPLERDDPEMKRLIVALEEAFRGIRDDNGYSATFPQERDFVVESLQNVKSSLETATSTSFGYLVRNAWQPLNIVLKRFGTAAVGIMAAGAKAALVEWLRKKGLHILVDLLGD